MARKCILNRETKRRALYDKYKAIREELKKKIKASRVDIESRKSVLKNVAALDKLPKMSTKTQIRNRCMLTGRARGLCYYAVFGMCGFKIREKANIGQIPGVYKV